MIEMMGGPDRDRTDDLFNVMPTYGSGKSSTQRPRFACDLTRAFISFHLFHFKAHSTECLDRIGACSLKHSLFT